MQLFTPRPVNTAVPVVITRAQRLENALAHLKEVDARLAETGRELLPFADLTFDTMPTLDEFEPFKEFQSTDDQYRLFRYKQLKEKHAQTLNEFHQACAAFALAKAECLKEGILIS
jgi:hypothetical protein